MNIKSHKKIETRVKRVSLISSSSGETSEIEVTIPSSGLITQIIIYWPIKAVQDHEKVNTPHRKELLR